MKQSNRPAGAGLLPKRVGEGEMCGWVRVSPHTPEAVSAVANQEYAATIPRRTLYAYNDQSAISVIDGAFDMIAEGKYWQFN